MKAKELVGKRIAEEVKDGQIIGVGTGSTVAFAIDAIGEKVKSENLDVRFVPTSYQVIWQLSERGLNVLDSHSSVEIEWGFDGADAVDSRLRAIKGKGAAMLSEKILAARCAKYYLLVDDSKYTDDILAKTHIPIEVIPQAVNVVKSSLKEIAAVDIEIRSAAKKQPILTENGNIVLDVKFEKLTNSLENDIKSIVGVVESGLFLNQADKVYIASDQDIRELVK